MQIWERRIVSARALGIQLTIRGLSRSGLSLGLFKVLKVGKYQNCMYVFNVC